MHKFHIEINQYLKQRTLAFYNLDYIGWQKPGNPDYINILKNTFGKELLDNIRSAAHDLEQTITPDLQQILRMSNASLTLCIVPRAKAENSYKANQVMFRTTVQSVGKKLGFVDGTMYITRHTDTKTTHLAKAINIANEGSMPYPGITEETCFLSPLIRNQDILLVDDIYTRSVNIDEDAIQALYNFGARSVIFYAVARTVRILE